MKNEDLRLKYEGQAVLFLKRVRKIKNILGAKKGFNIFVSNKTSSLMKKLFFSLMCIAAFFRFAGTANAQTLSLDSIAGFPDSVQDNQMVSMILKVSVSGGTQFTGDLVILMNAVNHDSIPDTLYYNPIDTVNGNGFVDSIPIEATFRAADLDGGDNIVVVWPSSQQSSVNSDSLTFHLVLWSDGVVELEKAGLITLFPNPSRSFLSIRYVYPEKVEQVRVFDVLGHDVRLLQGAVSKINTESLCSGIYFVEVKNRDHSSIVKKFFRE